MSTEYMPSKRIAFGRIKHFSYGGVRATVEDGDLFLTDGTSYLWVYPACKGRRVTFIRQGDNDVERIIEILEGYFRIWLVSEYEDEFFEIIKTERRIARRLRAEKNVKKLSSQCAHQESVQCSHLQPSSSPMPSGPPIP